MVEERHLEDVKYRCVYLGSKALQVEAIARKPKTSEAREVNACQRQRPASMIRV
jgi:hypothetical protein